MAKEVRIITSDRTRYMDRTQGMFKVLEIIGESQRKEKVWYL